MEINRRVKVRRTERPFNDLASKVKEDPKIFYVGSWNVGRIAEERIVHEWTKPAINCFTLLMSLLSAFNADE